MAEEQRERDLAGLTRGAADNCFLLDLASAPKSLDEINSAYRKMSLVHHPDKVRQDDTAAVAAAHLKMEKLTNAKNELTELVLRNDREREARDAQAAREEAIRRTRNMTNPRKIPSQDEDDVEPEATPFNGAGSYVHVVTPKDPHEPWV